jgi:hypothetical protein
MGLVTRFDSLEYDLAGLTLGTNFVGKLTFNETLNLTPRIAPRQSLMPSENAVSGGIAGYRLGIG